MNIKKLDEIFPRKLSPVKSCVTFLLIRELSFFPGYEYFLISVPLHWTTTSACDQRQTSPIITSCLFLMTQNVSIRVITQVHKNNSRQGMDWLDDNCCSIMVASSTLLNIIVLWREHPSPKVRVWMLRWSEPPKRSLKSLYELKSNKNIWARSIAFRMQKY